MNNVRLFSISASILLIFFVLNGCRNENKTCIWNSATTLYSDVLFHGDDTSYIHFVILDGLPQRCYDSIDVNKVISTYIDTLSDSNEKRNLEYIQFYNSSKNFNMGDMGQDLDKINRDFLFDVRLNKMSKKVLQVKNNPWEIFPDISPDQR